MNASNTLKNQTQSKNNEQTEQAIPKFKIVLLGENGVGKTAFVTRCSSDRFLEDHVPTANEVNTLIYMTTYGPVCFKIHSWDANWPGQHDGDGYCEEADACIIMFDLSQDNSHLFIGSYMKDFQKINDGAMVLVGTKSDIGVIDKKKINYTVKQLQLSYFPISSKTADNHEWPLLHLAKKLMKANDLQFI